MNTSLADFLIDLASDPAKTLSHRADPVASVRAAGLSESAAKAVLSSNTSRIHGAIDAEGASWVAATTTGTNDIKKKGGKKKGGKKKGGKKK